MAHTPEIEKFIQLKVQGTSLAEISKTLNVSKPTLISWSRTYIIEIENLKSLEVEHIRKKFSFSREKNLEKLLQISTKIDVELLERDFNSIPTDKLLKLSLELKSQINALSETKLKYDAGWNGTLLESSIIETTLD